MSRLTPGHQYTGGCGERARRRYLRQIFARVEKLKDRESRAALLRAHQTAAGEPDPVEALYHLVHVALQAAEECTASGNPTTWAQAMTHILDEFEVNAEMGVTPTDEAGA